MILRNSTFLSILLSLLVPVPQLLTAAPLVSIGDNTDVFFNGSSSLQWSSNVFRDEDDEEDDLLWTLSPGFEVKFGRGLSNLDLSMVTRYEIRRYFDLDDIDTELFSMQLNGSYRSSRLDLSGSAFYAEQQSSTGDSNLDNDLIESTAMGGQINAEYRFSPKFSFGGGFNYSETTYDNPYDFFFADREKYTIPFDVFYELTPKVDLSVGYAYSETDVSDRPATLGDTSYTKEDHFFNVGARGKLLPKVTGFFKIGYRTGDDINSDGDSRDTLGLTSSLSWAATPKLSHSLGLSRDFGVGGEGDSNVTTSVNLNTNYSINSFYAATAHVRYALQDYDSGREDNQYHLGLRLEYTPNQYWRFGAGYTFSENDSDRFGSSYTEHTVDLTATLRY